MTLWVFIVCLTIMTIVNNVIFRFEPPDRLKINIYQTLLNEKPNIARKKFRNQAVIEIMEVMYCMQYDQTYIKCEKCYEGFILENQICVADLSINYVKNREISNIMSYNVDGESKEQINKIILNRNPFCSEMAINGTFCLSCYSTFILIDGNCVQNQNEFTIAQQLYLRPMNIEKNTFCRSFDQDGNCIKCFPQILFDDTTHQCIIKPQPTLDCKLHQLCLPKITQCLTYSSQGYCKSCQKGAVNLNGICRINKPQSLCLFVQSKNNSKCKKCSGYAININGTCRAKPLHCLQFHLDGTCRVCKATFRRVNGQCIRPSRIMFLKIDPNCATWKQGFCIQCKYSFGFYKQYCHSMQQLQKAGISADPDLSMLQLFQYQ